MKPFIYKAAIIPLLFACSVHAADSNRPQLSKQQAALYSYEEVLKYKGAAGHETEDSWDPLTDGLSTDKLIKPDYVVDLQSAEDGKSHFRSVQTAVDRASRDASALAATGKNRIVIEIHPGIYHELLYVPSAALPITLVGTGADATSTKISADLDAAVSGNDYVERFGAQFSSAAPAIRSMYEAVKSKSMVETVGSAITWIKNDGFQAKNLTFENAYNKAHGDAKAECPPGGCSATMIGGVMQVVHHQAVALMIDGADKVHFDNVRLIGFQDTLFLKSRAEGITARSFFDHSYIEGDVDFIFGDTTAFFYRSEIKSLGDRSTSYVVAPATNYLTKYGFVFDHCRFTHDDQANSLAGKFYLGRQWFHSQRCTPYAPLAIGGYQCRVGAQDFYQAPQGEISQGVLETVGKTVILHSQIGAHINKDHPWSNWNAKGSLAYRPVQYDSDDYWNNLNDGGIDPVATLHYASKKNPVEVFLGEYEDTSSP